MTHPVGDSIRGWPRKSNHLLVFLSFLFCFFGRGRDFIEYIKWVLEHIIIRGIEGRGES